MTGPRILVVGGGITGLAAAWEATQAGAPVLLAEAGPRLGGKIRTDRFGGILVENGPDSFVTYRRAALDLIDEVGLSGDVIPVQQPRMVWIRIGGRLRPLPDGMGMVLPTRIAPFLTTRVLTPVQKMRAALDLALPRRLDESDTSIGQFLRGRLGDGVVDRLAEPMVGGIYSAGIDSLSLDAVLPSLRASEAEHRSLMLASLAQGRRARRRAGATGASSPFASLADGLGSLTERLRELLIARGADLRTRTPVQALEPTRSGTTATFGDGTTARFDAVVLAVGAPQMAALLTGPARQAALALRCVPYTTSAVVTLAFPTSAVDGTLRGHGWLEADRAAISGATISSNKWAGRAPADVVLIRAFVPDRLGPLARGSDPALWRTVSTHVGEVLGIRGEPRLARVSRWEDAMPTYTVGHLRRVAEVEATLSSLPGWFAAGSALHGVGIPECIADGRRAAASAVAVLAGAGA